jgi:HKD family nuclease
METTIILSSERLLAEFARLCRDYDCLDLAVAWCGDPDKVLPFSHLHNVSGKIRIVLGTAFMQTHPKAIQELMDTARSLRVMRDDSPLFHPKVYHFSKGESRAIILGSANFTYSGFCINTEASILVEGSFSELIAIGYDRLMDQFETWQSDEFSFEPTEEWLHEYRRRWETARRTERNSGITTPVHKEVDVPSGSWLGAADWGTFLVRLQRGLEENERDINGYFRVLDDAAEKLRTPWSTRTFNDISNRRIIGGIGDYGWLGHVSASGRFRKMLANGTQQEKFAIANAVNEVSSMSPIQWDRLETILDDLVSLGPTIKVWGRLLCLVRPDSFCSVASDSLRKNLAQTLGMPVSAFLTPNGYVALLRHLHSSPWINSPEPRNEAERHIWKNRVALIDPIFY